MILYSSPLACSVAAQLVLLELGLAHEVRFVDIYVQPHVLIEDGSRYDQVNPKDAVPALQLDDGQVLTEIGVILQYLADQVPASGLLPPAGTPARYRVMEWLSFIASDVHKSIGPLFNPRMPEEGRQVHRDNLQRRLAYIEGVLAQQAYLAGAHFSVADAYLFVMLGWEPHVKLSPAGYPNLARWHARIGARPAVVQVLQQLAPVLAGMKLPAFPAAHQRLPGA